MGLLDGALGSLAGNFDVNALAAQFGIDINAVAAKIGLTPEQVTQILQALGVAHQQPGDTAVQASEQTGLPLDKIKAVIQQIGGEDVLAKLGALAGNLGGLGGALGKF